MLIEIHLMSLSFGYSISDPLSGSIRLLLYSVRFSQSVSVKARCRPAAADAAGKNCPHLTLPLASVASAPRMSSCLLAGRASFSQLGITLCTTLKRSGVDKGKWMPSSVYECRMVRSLLKERTYRFISLSLRTSSSSSDALRCYGRRGL